MHVNVDIERFICLINEKMLNLKQESHEFCFKDKQLPRNVFIQKTKP